MTCPMARLIRFFVLEMEYGTFSLLGSLVQNWRSASLGA